MSVRIMSLLQRGVGRLRGGANVAMVLSMVRLRYLRLEDGRRRCRRLGSGPGGAQIRAQAGRRGCATGCFCGDGRDDPSLCEPDYSRLRYQPFHRRPFHGRFGPAAIMALAQAKTLEVAANCFLIALVLTGIVLPAAAAAFRRSAWKRSSLCCEELLNGPRWKKLAARSVRIPIRFESAPFPRQPGMTMLKYIRQLRMERAAGIVAGLGRLNVTWKWRWKWAIPALAISARHFTKHLVVAPDYTHCEPLPKNRCARSRHGVELVQFPIFLADLP